MGGPLPHARPALARASGLLAAPGRTPLPRAGRAAAPAARLVGRERGPARVRLLRLRGRGLRVLPAPLPHSDRRARRPPRAPADDGRDGRRPGRAGSAPRLRPRRALGAAGSGHPACRGDGRPRRIGLHADGDGRGAPDGGRAVVRRPARERPPGRGARRRGRARARDVRRRPALAHRRDRGRPARRPPRRRSPGCSTTRGTAGAAQAVAAEIAQQPPVDDAVALLADAARGDALAA